MSLFRRRSGSTTGSDGAPGRAAELILEAERALAKGDSSLWAQCLDEAIAAHVTARDYASAATLAERLKDPKRAARLWFRAGEFRRAAEHHRALDEPLEAADLFERAREFGKAAEIFEELGDLARASVLYEKAGEKRRSADLLMATVSGSSLRPLAAGERVTSLARAGLLYEELGLFAEASEAYLQGGHIASAAKLMASSGRLAEASDLIAASGDLLAAAELARMGGDERKALLLLAARAEAEGFLAEAAAYYEQAKDFAQAAIIHEFAGDPLRAAEAHERAQNFDTAASLFKKLGRTTEAARCLRAAGKDHEATVLLETSDENTIALHLARGDFLAAAGEHMKRARLGEREAYVEARRCLARYASDHPRYVVAQTLTAEILEEEGDRQEAIRVVRALLSLPRQGADAHEALYLQGRLLEAEGFFAEARATYRRLFAIDPTFKDTALRLRHLTEASAGPSISTAGSRWPSTSLPLRTGLDERGHAPLETMDDDVTARSSVPRLGVPRSSVPRLSASRQSDSRHGGSSPRPSLDRHTGPLLPDDSEHTPPPLPSPPRTEGGESVFEISGSPSPVQENESFDLNDPIEPIELVSEVVTGSSIISEPLYFRPLSLEGVVLRGRFKIEREVGRGAQARVYLARDTVLERPVAIKVLEPSASASDEGMSRFLHEARVAARVHHPACVAIFDFGTERGLTFIAMEFVEGRPIASVLEAGPLPPRRALEIARRTADALAAAHVVGVMHGDLRPANLLLDEANRLRVTDFGVAAIATFERDRGTSFAGSTKYMSPEQAHGQPIDERSDIYSLGIVLYEMLTGRPPFEASLAALAARLTQPPPRIPEEIATSEHVRDVVARCMALDPADRYQTASDLVAHLDRELSSMSQGRTP